MLCNTNYTQSFLTQKILSDDDVALISWGSKQILS